MSQLPELGSLRPAQMAQAAAMLARAFQHDPFASHVYPAEVERTRRLPLMFDISLRYTLGYDTITVTSDLMGLACWLPPQHTRVRLGRLVRVGALPTALRMGFSALRRMNDAEIFMERMHERVVAGPHWYLWTLGVDPARQGQGIGGLLLRVGLERADAADLPCYLETTQPGNVAFYQKFGFAIASEHPIPGSHIHLWGMLRPARPSGKTDPFSS